MPSQSPAIVAIIPARYASTRFPGKPLVKIKGMTMIEHVYRRAARCRLVAKVLVATDDERIAQAVQSFGGNCAMTRQDHVSGTDRLAEVVGRSPEIDIIVNVQGDEPLIDPQAIDAAIEPLLSDSSLEMSTLACRIASQEQANRSEQVKVVIDKCNRALYFSRAPIPFYRDGRPFAGRQYLGHIGLYVYRRNCLLALAAGKPTELEMAESLEQLRALETGVSIYVVKTDYNSHSVDVPEDVKAIVLAL